MSNKKIAPFNTHMEQHPFIMSVVLAAVCNVFLYVSYLLYFALLTFMEEKGIPVNVSPLVGSIISVVFIVSEVLFTFIAALAADCFYAIKAESKLGFFIWFIGIPIFFGLFYITPRSGHFNGFSINDILNMYYYRLLPFILVRSYSYLARDEKRRKNAKRQQGAIEPKDKERA